MFSVKTVKLVLKEKLNPLTKRCLIKKNINENITFVTQYLLRVKLHSSNCFRLYTKRIEIFNVKTQKLVLKERTQVFNKGCFKKIFS